MSVTKMVRRSTAITLGIVCVVLIVGLGGAMAYYTKAINDKNAQYDSLQAEVSSLQAPEVWKVNLKGDDFYLPSQTSRLHVYGYLFNAGTMTATGVRLHVVLYSLDYIFNDTYVDAGSIGGRTWTSIDANVTYDGSVGFTLTGWTITPQWTT